jgi:hypothetical protein
MPRDEAKPNFKAKKRFKKLNVPFIQLNSFRDKLIENISKFKMQQKEKMLESSQRTFETSLIQSSNHKSSRYTSTPFVPQKTATSNLQINSSDKLFHIN